MASVSPVYIYFLNSEPDKRRDKDHPDYNKQLCQFLRVNIEAIVRKGRMKLLFKVINPADDKAFLKKRGITKLPAAIFPNAPPVIGVPDIIHALTTRTQASKQLATPKTDEEIIREMQEKSLGVVKKDSSGKFMQSDDQEQDTTFDPSKRMSDELERRRKMGGNAPLDDMRRPAPSPGASWSATPDFDGYDINPTVHMGRRDAEQHSGIRPVARADNTGEDDPMKSLSKLRADSSDQANDDRLMSMLLMNGSASN